MVRILIVDDDIAIVRMLKKYLIQEGFEVNTAENGEQAFKSMTLERPDMILLDVTLPGEDGFMIAQKIRRSNQDVGIMMVTGKKDLIDRIVGLEMGADDYISKPFHLREILARIKSILRRKDYSKNVVLENWKPESEKESEKGSHKSLVYFDGWKADLGAKTLKGPNGDSVTLTSGDFRLLELFLRNSQCILSRDQILDYVAARQWEPFDRSVDTRIRRLRNKIEKDPNTPEMIRTVRGEGYLFSVTVTPTP